MAWSKSWTKLERPCKYENGVHGEFEASNCTTDYKFEFGIHSNTARPDILMSRCIVPTNKYDYQKDQN